MWCPVESGLKQDLRRVLQYQCKGLSCQMVPETMDQYEPMGFMKEEF